MKNNFIRNAILFLSISILLTGCEIKPVEIGNIEGAKLIELTGKHVSLEISIPVKNPNNFAFKIKDINMDIKLNDTKVGKVKKVDKIVVPANSNDVHNFLIEVEFSELLTGALSLFSSLMKGKVKIGLKGHFKVGAFMILTKKIEIDEERVVNLSKM